jgi:hypothetical protein
MMVKSMTVFLTDGQLVMQVAREFLFRCESLDRRPDAAPAPIVAEDPATEFEQHVVVEQVLIDILLLVAAVDINEVCPQVSA